MDKLEYFSAQMDAINRPQNDCYPDTFESVTEVGVAYGFSVIINSLHMCYNTGIMEFMYKL